MLFNSYEFLLLFLPVCVLVFYLLGGRARSVQSLIFLIFASLVFYGKWNPPFVFLILFSIAANYALSHILEKQEGSIKRAVLILGVVLNLGLIGYFKYANFFVGTANQIFGSDYHLHKIILPLAISFFTFQQIAYLVDIYTRKAQAQGLVNYAFFVIFFPQLIAGPIVHHSEMFPQIRKRIFENDLVKNIAIGISIFSLGLFKKVVFADGLATYATPVFQMADAGGAVSFIEAWGGAISYSLQLYFDFSGYSDMAIGLALIFGFKLPMNFYSPYKAGNIINFWRRWHITLSRFLRDYLYIPLGGNQKGLNRRYVNLLITMLLGGLWHGAAWTFVLWGGLHGVYLMINHLWRSFRKKLGKQDLSSNFTYKLFSYVLTFLCVVVAWVFFRAETLSGGLSIVFSMFGANGFGGPDSFRPWRNAEIYIPACLLIVYLMPNIMDVMSRYEVSFDTYKRKKKDRSLLNIEFKLNKRWALFIGLCLAIAITRMSSVSEFLYFQF